jgi:choline dehydrogenase-like flavoprotein
MNAALVSLLVSKNLFPIGNHATLKLFNLRFRRMQSLGNLIQNYSRTSASFLSFTYPKDKSKLSQESPEVSIRFNYKDKESVRRMFNLGSRNIRDMFEIFARFIAEKILKIHLYRIVSIVAWIEIQIEASNFMRIEKVDNGIFQITIRLVPSEFIQSQIDTARYNFQKHLAKNRFSLSLVDKHQEDAYFTQWVDTAHYFGTVPMHQFETCQGTVENSLFCTVSNNFELNGHPGIYVIGNSSIPQGGHGHPTAMAVSLANVFVESTLNAN